MRKLRHVPEPRTLVEVTTRTLQGILLLRPGILLNEIILGVLGRAQRLFNSNLAREVARLTGWKEKMLARFMTDRELPSWRALCFRCATLEAKPEGLDSSPRPDSPVL